MRAAQFAMRQQVSQNIAYSAYQTDVIGKAVIAESASRAVEMIDGEGYTVRQTPPTYFFQESQRLERTAAATQGGKKRDGLGLGLGKKRLKIK